MNKKDRNLHRAIFIDGLKQHCEEVMVEALESAIGDTKIEKFNAGLAFGRRSEAEYILQWIKGFEVSLTNNETQVIELLRQNMNESLEHDCDYECYYGKAGCPEEIVKHHYRCDGCKAREIQKQIEILENREDEGINND